MPGTPTDSTVADQQPSTTRRPPIGLLQRRPPTRNSPASMLSTSRADVVSGPSDRCGPPSWPKIGAVGPRPVPVAGRSSGPAGSHGPCCRPRRRLRRAVGPHPRRNGGRSGPHHDVAGLHRLRDRMAIGIVVGSLAVRVRAFRSAFGSFITGLQTMPSIAWFPLAILLFQLSEGAITFVVCSRCPGHRERLISGADNIPPIQLRAGKVLGAKGISMYRYIVLPGSMPGSSGASSRAGRSPGAA